MGNLDARVVDGWEGLGAATRALLKGPAVAISGGDTYARLFPYWVGAPGLASIAFFPVDERRVPFTDPGCNWRVAEDKLFRPAGLAGQTAHLAVSANQYEALLRAELGPRPAFDQVFLGMGDDGHTASLFPGGAYLADDRSLALETESPKPPFPRVTLGLRPLWEARELVAVAAGAGKAPMVRRLLDGDESLPITLALRGHPRPLLLLDRAAAGG